MSAQECPACGRVTLRRARVPVKLNGVHMFQITETVTVDGEERFIDYDCGRCGYAETRKETRKDNG